MAHACTASILCYCQWHRICKLAHYVDRRKRHVRALLTFYYCMYIHHLGLWKSNLDSHDRWIYNIAVRSGIFKLFRRWMLTNTPADKRVFLILIAYSFSAVLEGELLFFSSRCMLHKRDETLD